MREGQRVADAFNFGGLIVEMYRGSNSAPRLKSPPFGSFYTSKISPPILPSFSLFPPTLCLIARRTRPSSAPPNYFLLTTGAPVGPRGVTGLPPEFMPWY